MRTRSWLYFTALFLTVVLSGCGFDGMRSIPSTFSKLPVAASLNYVSPKMLVAIKTNGKGELIEIFPLFELDLEVKEALTYELAISEKKELQLSLDGSVGDAAKAKLKLMGVESLQQNWEDAKILFNDAKVRLAIRSQLTDDHWSIIKAWRSNGYKVAVVAEVFKANVRITWSYSTELSVNAKAKMDERLCATLDAKLTSSGTGVLNGEGLVWAMRYILTEDLP